jgi:eukaryotic-like serine/threonine-protein kinase
MTGLHLSHYSIEAELGRGGMGIVYKATDTKLKRTVALKVLPASALASSDDRARFFREAQSAASISHPNVCHVYQVDEAVPLTPDGTAVEGQTEKRLFIAMEYITGETLQDYVKKAPLKLVEAVSIAGQIAEALKEAHAKEIVHRDIKSANVMLTESGVAKVLDFGLAKTNQSTMLTRMGSTLGTVAYMSPEQARGEEVDGRSDLYSLGTVLYEMIAGKLPFAGDYEQAVLYSILNEPPEPLTAVRTGVPMQMEWIVEKLLSKEAEYRYQTAGDLLADLKSVDLSGSGLSRRSMPAVSAARLPVADARTVPTWIWGAIAAGLVIVFAAGWFLKPTPPEPERVVGRFPVTLPEGQEVTGNTRLGITISPDGRLIVYQANRSLFLRRLDAPDDIQELPGTLGGLTPAFSPDSEWLAFAQDGFIMKMRAYGGTADRIVSIPEGVYGLHWSEANTITAGVRTGGIARINPDSGSMVYLVPPDSTGLAYQSPHLLPGGKKLLYTRAGDSPENSRIMFLDLQSGKHEIVYEGGSDGRYLKSGHLVYIWNNSLWARAFDPASGQAPGPSISVEDEVSHSWGRRTLAQWALSGSGTLVKTPHHVGETRSTEIRLMTMDGSWAALTPEGSFRRAPAFSPNGEKLAVLIDAVGDDSIRDIWIYDVSSGNRVQLTSEGTVSDLVWSPDGLRVAYALSGDASLILARTPGDPTSLETLYESPESGTLATSWTESGLVIQTRGQRNDISLFNIDTKTLTPLIATAEDEAIGRISSNGRWIAYQAAQGGEANIYVQLVSGQGSKIKVSPAGGSKPAWGAGGTSIFYRTPDGGIDWVSFDPETGAVGPKVVLAQPRTLGGGDGFDVSPTGEHVAIVAWNDEEYNARMEIVVNWDLKFSEKMRSSQ